MVRVHHGSPQIDMFKKNELRNQFKYFLDIYKKRPIQNNYSGMKIDHCYALFCFLKKIKPKFVIESGIWKGQTTWLIKETLKNVKIFSIDIDLSNREIIYDDVTYLSKDISNYNWKNIDTNKTLIIFDDHVCFSKRLIFLKKNKFKHIIFDDNLPNGFIGYYTPKIIYEKNLLVHQEFIKYTNLSRLLKFVSNFFFKKNYFKNYKIFFKLKFIKIVNKNYNNKKLNINFNEFRKKITTYYEFPPLTKFNLKKRFNKLVKNFDENINIFPYNVKKPITKLKNLKLDKKLSKELNQQYGNICYIKLKKFK